MMDVPGYGFHVGLRRRIPKRRRPDDSEGVPGYGIYGSRNIFDTISPVKNHRNDAPKNRSLPDENILSQSVRRRTRNWFVRSDVLTSTGIDIDYRMKQELL
jgi:hypothetical protein